MKILYKLSRILLFSLVLLCGSTLGMPNIRIQVNNENLQSPPYLLEALKRVEPSDLAAGTTNQATQNEAALNRQGSVTSQSDDTRTLLDVKDYGIANSPNVVREEIAEELVNSEPESELSATPDNAAAAALQSSVHMETSDAQSSGEIAGAALETSLHRPKADGRKPQLPVTSSHLKRPAGVLDDGDHESASAVMSETRAQMDDESTVLIGSAISTGPESRISPSVAADEGVTVGRKQHGMQSPDTLEPSQVMSGVSNVSLVPATITRQYGANSRTRVTLGGGYVRNKQSASSERGSEATPDKSNGPLEKPKYQTGEQEKSAHEENSRLIEVPERIVLPANVFTNNQKIFRDNFLLLNVTTSDENQHAPLGLPDSRCPPKGMTTLEHPNACDKYFYCDDGHISEHVCPNGLMYGTRNFVKDNCVHRWEAVCGDKTVPNPISSPGCRWQWGIFNVQGSPRCTPDFYECRAGKFEVRKCANSGQVYDDRTKSCRFAEQVGCAEEALADFRCPPDDQGNTYWPFPRYFLNDRALIHCINDKPAIIRCRDNERVDPEHLHCVLVNKSSKSLKTGDDLTSRSIKETNNDQQS